MHSNLGETPAPQENANRPEPEEKLPISLQLEKVFSEPVQMGNLTVITASQFISTRRRTVRKPIAAIVLDAGRVQVKPVMDAGALSRSALVFTGLLVWGIAFILHPPWPNQGWK